MSASKQIRNFVIEGDNNAIFSLEITNEDIIHLYAKQKGRCHYSGLPLKEEFNHIPRHPFAISVERLDNKKGYVLDNIKLTRRLFNLG